MNGIAWAIAGGIGFGVFQAVHRRVNRVIDAYTSTLLLLVGATVWLGIVAALTQDLSVLFDAPAWAYLAYMLAGTVHFFFGWTFLNLSQRRTGAARTGVVVAATPLVGSVMAWIFVSEPLSPATLLGVVAVSAGVVLIARDAAPSREASRWHIPWAGLGASLMWGTSPVIIRWGLDGLESPLLGLTLGLATASLLYGAGMRARARRITVAFPPVTALRWVFVSSILVAFALASQWKAWELIEISVAITLLQLATPTVVILAPLLTGDDTEYATRSLLLGMAAVVGGSMLVVWTGSA